MLKLRIVSFLIAVILICGAANTAEAGIMRGVGYVAAGLFEIPRSVIAGTFGGPPIIGTVFGLVSGVFRTVGFATRGAMEIVGSAVPLAMKLVPLIPVFL